VGGGSIMPSSPPPPDLVVHVRAPLFAYVVARYWWRATRWLHLVHGGLASPPSIDWVAHARYHSPIQFSILNYNFKSKCQNRFSKYCKTLPHTWPVQTSNQILIFKLKFQYYGSSPGYFLRLMFVYTTRDIYLTLNNIQIWNLFKHFHESTIWSWPSINSYDCVLWWPILTCYMLNNSFEFSLFIIIIFEIYILIGNPTVFQNRNVLKGMSH
jgi:hypothetical protein